MDSPEQFEKLTTFVFRYFDVKGKGRVPAMHLGNMLRSLGQVWSYSELMEALQKQGDRDVTLQAYQKLANNRRQAEARALGNKGKSKVEDGKLRPVAGLSEAEMKEVNACFSLLDPENTMECSVHDLTHILTCLGETLSYSDVQSLLLLERLDGKEYLSFNEFARLCSRI